MVYITPSSFWIGRKAFDTALLQAKLKFYRIADKALNLFESYFTGRLQVTSVNGKFLSSRTVMCGVPQGSILGPLLLVCNNDRPNCLRHTSTRLFADDANITASGKSIEEMVRTLIFLMLSAGFQQTNSV